MTKFINLKTKFIFSFALFLFSAMICPAQTYTLRGKVVDTQNKGIYLVPITIKCGVESYPTEYSEKGGSYAINFHSCPIINVVYGDGRYHANAIINLSGQSNHIVTKVLKVNDGKTALTSAEAAEVFASLDYFEANPEAFSKEILEYSGMINEERLPDEFRGRLSKFEAAAVAIRVRSDPKPLEGNTAQGKENNLPKKTPLTLGRTAKLRGRSDKKSAMRIYSVPAGTTLRMRMNQTLSSKTARVGDTFTATVTEPVYSGTGVIVIPVGSTVLGRVDQVKAAAKGGKPGTIDATFVELKLPNGTRKVINGSLAELDTKSANSYPEGTASGDKMAHRKVIFIGAGGAGGAVLGGAIGGGKGAVIGGIAGAVGGLIAENQTKGKDATVESGTEFGVYLNKAVSLPRSY